MSIVRRIKDEILSMEVSNADLADPLSPSALFRILECPVCMDVPFPPIYQCIRGHNICKICRPKLNVCALCRSRFSETRNYAVEQIILSSNHSCPFKSHGCEAVHTWESMENHVKVCTFRPIKCPMIGDKLRCKADKLKVTEVRDHLVNIHDATVYTGSSHTISHVFMTAQIDIDNPQIQFAYRPNIFEVGGTCFWTTAFRLNHMIYWTVLCIGTKEDAQKYTAEITLEPFKVPKIHWTIAVSPIARGTEHIYMDPPSVMNMFNPSCSIADFKKFADLGNLNDGTPYYCFVTNCTIQENAKPDIITLN